MPSSVPSMPACCRCRCRSRSGSAARRPISTSCAASSPLGRGRRGRHRRPRRIPRRRRAGISRGPSSRRHGRHRIAAREAGRSPAARRRRHLLHPVLVGQHAPSSRRADHPGRADGQPCRHHRARRPRRRRRRSGHELAAALSRHGPDRVPVRAALCPALDRLSDAARLRAPADAVAEPDLEEPRQHLLQPELRLRPRGAPRRPQVPADLDLSSWLMPASAATWCGPTCSIASR